MGNTEAVSTDTDPPLQPRKSYHEDPYGTEVPLESGLLRDPQGQLIFLGDCAPLSFLQTVRHLVATEVGPDGLQIRQSRDSVIELTSNESSSHHRGFQLPPIVQHEVESMISEYVTATSGLVDLFPREKLLHDMNDWARSGSATDEVISATFYLVLAIGAQSTKEAEAEAWFQSSRDVLQKKMCSRVDIPTLQGLVLVTLYMLRASQSNGAYLYFCVLCCYSKHSKYELTSPQHWPPEPLIRSESTEQK